MSQDDKTWEAEPEDKTTEFKTEARIDPDVLFEELQMWLKREVKQDRLDRVFNNLFHMAMTLGTAGTYIFIYLGYVAYKYKKHLNREGIDYVKEYKVEEVKE